MANCQTIIKQEDTRVAAIQRELQRLGVSIKVDGIWGTCTLQAVQDIAGDEVIGSANDPNYTAILTALQRKVPGGSTTASLGWDGTKIALYLLAAGLGFIALSSAEKARRLSTPAPLAGRKGRSRHKPRRR